MSCPHPDCPCRCTWGFEDEVRRALEASRAEFFRTVANGGPLPAGVGLELWYYRLRDAQWRDHASRGDDPWLREFDALYLFGTIGTEAVMRGDGRVWVRPDAHWDDATAPVPEWRPATQRERVAALVIASERMPDVAVLLPSRPADASKCGRCSGSGRLISVVLCQECDGMGWVATQGG